MIRRIVAISAAIVLLMCSFSISASAYILNSSDAPEINAQSAIMINLNTDEVIYEKNSDIKEYPASFAKVMTALIAFENIDDLSTVITVSEDVIKNTSGNNISLKADEEVTARDLLYATLVSGANDAANMLAYYVGGSIENFVSMMNVRASELGAINTNFTNPNGVHNQNMYTTAKDMAMIIKAFALKSELVEMSSVESYKIEKTNKSGERTKFNKNLILSSKSSYYYKYAKGINSGNTNQAGYNLATLATNKGIPVLCIVMHSTVSTEGVVKSYKDVYSLCNWAFSSYENVTVLNAKQISYEMPVKMSALTDFVLLYAADDISLLMPVTVDVEKDIQKVYKLYSDTIEAPVKKDTVVGELLLVYDGNVIAKTELLTSSDVERTATLYYLDRIDKIIETTWFKVSFVCFVMLSCAYFVLSYLQNKSRNNRKNKLTVDRKLQRKV